MRMYEAVFQGPYVPPFLLGGLSHCRVIAIDNVVDYLIETGKNIYTRDLPRLTLPFDHCVIDIVGRDRARAWFKMDTISKAGFFVWNCHDAACTVKQQADIQTPIRWSVHGMLFLCTKCEQVHIPDITWTFNLDEFGRWAEKTPPCYRYNRNSFANTPSDDPEVYFEAAEQIIPALFALALMHAKNSSLLDNEAPAKLSKSISRNMAEA